MRLPLACALSITCVLATLPARAAAETVAAGQSHTVLVKPDGTVWTWGYNGTGQLGDGTQTQRATPVQVTTLVNIVGVAAGANHTLALDSSGTVWAWGYNFYGQLGDNSTSMRTSPVVVGGLPNVIAIAAGTSHSVALGADGSVWTWGRNDQGQLGNGNMAVTQSNAPLLISSGWTATAIAAGRNHTLVVRTGGELWGWGANGSGQLDDGTTTTPRSSAVRATGITGAVAAAGGSAHSLVLLSNGQVWATGDDSSGQLGDNGSTARSTMAQVAGVPLASAVAAGQSFSSVRTQAGEVWSWGAGTSGQIGDGAGTTRRTPVKTTLTGTITHHAAGDNHGIAVTSTGIVYTWGYNLFNQLGDGTTVARLTPVAISDINYQWRVATPSFSVAGGTYYTDQTVAITDATPGAEIHYTTNGVDPTTTDPLVPPGGVAIDRSMTLKAKAWKTGMPFSQVNAVVYTMSVFSIGASPLGGTFTSAVTVTLSETMTPSVSIRYTTDGTDPTSTSPLYSGALTFGTTTTLKAAGFRTGWTTSSILNQTYRMNFGQLAPPTIAPAAGTYTSSVTVSLSSISGATIYYTTNGTTPSQFSTLYTAPFAVSSSLTVKAIAMHPDYTTSGVASTVYTIAVANPTFSPAAGTYPATQLITVSDATAGATIRYTLDGRDPTDTDPIIASGATLTIGNYTLKARASKSGCTTSGVTTATYQTSGALTTAQVDGGSSQSVLVRPDGIAWTWGYESGNGSYAGSWLPIQPAGITGIKSVSTGGSQFLLAASTGTLYAWGQNGSGEVGDGTTNTRLTPIVLTTITGVSKVAAGGSHSMALKSDGTVWTWGLNTSGQIGDNTIVSPRPSPVSAGLTGMTAVAAGSQFSLALKSTGAIYSWGDNTHGQLGDGTTTQRHAPVSVSTPRHSVAVAIAAGDSFALALMNDGTVLAWGDNWAGQLGLGTTTQVLTPTRIPSLSGVTAIAAGGSHALAITSGGIVYSWGNNIRGQLGYATGTNQYQATPTQIPGLSGIIAIGGGMAHSHAIAGDGTVWAWGGNDWGQLGDGTTTARSQPVRISGSGYVWKAWAPSITPPGNTYNVVQTATITNTDPTGATLHYTLTGVDPTAADPVVVSGGTITIDHSLTLKVSAWKTGAPTSEVASAVYDMRLLPPVFSPVTGSYTGPISVTVSTPVQGATIRYTVDGTEPTDTSSSYSGPITVSQTSTIKAKIYNPGWTTSDSAYASYSITGPPVAAPQFTPPGGTYTSVQLVRIVSATPGATIRYTLDGSTPNERSTPYRFALLVPSTTTITAQAFKSGMTPSPVVSASFVVDAAGASSTPTIAPAGGRFTVHQTVTVQAAAGATLHYTVDGRDPAETDPSVAPGGTIAVDRSEVLKVRAWQAGALPSAVRSAFFVITGQVSAGRAHTVALKSDGTVWAWGYNQFGSVGDGTSGINTNRLSPVQIAISDVQAIAAANYHSLALKRDGTVWGWGYNACGQVGDGSTNERDSPVQVSGLTNVVAIAAGGEQSGFITGHSLALKADGTVWAWGCNGSGELGDATNTARTMPVRVVALSGVTAIAARDRFSMALEGEGATVGAVWAWGDNGAGQLGDGSIVSRNVPVKMPAFSDATAIAAGIGFGMAQRADGSLWDWGYTMNRSTVASATPPAQFAFLSSVVTMAGGDSGFAVTRDGWRWAWGLNTWGELGNNYACSTGTVCLVAGRVNASPADLQISSGDTHTVWVRTDGTVAAAGYNLYGELGNGTQTDSAVPFVVPGFSVADNAWLATDDDQDGLTAWREWLAGTDPYNPDTNGNGILDGIEESDTVSALNPDTDGDGLSNAAELLLGTDPYVADTDGDGVLDGADAFPLDPTRSAMPPPNPLDTTPPIIILKEPTTARPVGGGGL